MTITEFLTARLDEDEVRLAPPYFIEENSWRGPGWGTRGPCPICGTYQHSGYESVTEDAWYDHAEDIHQRTRVLAEVEAKRRIVAARAAIGFPEGADIPDGQGLVWLDGAHVAVAAERDRTLRMLALPYTDHPDYDEAWRV